MSLSDTKSFFVVVLFKLVKLPLPPPLCLCDILCAYCIRLTGLLFLKWTLASSLVASSLALFESAIEKAFTCSSRSIFKKKMHSTLAKLFCLCLLASCFLCLTYNVRVCPTSCIQIDSASCVMIGWFVFTIEPPIKRWTLIGGLKFFMYTSQL